MTNSLKLNLDFQEIIEDQWATIKQLYLGLREISEDELSHYQLIILHKQLREKWSDEQIDKYERDFA